MVSPFFSFTLRRLAETTDAVTLSVRTLPNQQLRSEREALREDCSGLVCVGPAALMLSIFDGELARRVREGSRG